MRKTCTNGKCLTLLVNLNIYNHTYEEGSASGKNSWWKLVLIVSDVTRSFTSMLITFLVQSIGQRGFSTLMMLISSCVVRIHVLCFELKNIIYG